MQIITNGERAAIIQTQILKPLDMVLILIQDEKIKGIIQEVQKQLGEEIAYLMLDPTYELVCRKEELRSEEEQAIDDSTDCFYECADFFKERNYRDPESR